MKYHKLGKTDFNISEITFGCWELGGEKWEKTSDEENIKVLRTALDSGINIFDTAVNYGNGHSEKVVGLALNERRKECIIATKVKPENLKPSDVRIPCEESLKRLKTDYIDVLYIHWPNKEIPLKDTLSEFNKLKDEKLIKSIGVSNFSIEQLKEAAIYSQIDVLQLEYSLLQRGLEDEIMPYCIENSIGLTSYSSIAKGILTGVYHLGILNLKSEDFRSTRRLFLPDHLEKEKELIYLIKEIAEAKNIEMSQVAVSWLLHQKGLSSAIVGTQSIKHLLENIKAAEIELTKQELDILDKTSKRVLKEIDG